MNFLVVFTAEFLLDWLSFIQPIGELNISPWNPYVALHLFFLLNAKRNFLPIIVSGIAGNYLIRSTELFSLNNLEPIISVALYLIAAASFKKLFLVTEIFKVSKNFLKFAFFCMFVAAIHGILLSSYFFVIGELQIDQISRSFLSILIGDSTGLLIFSPVLLLAYSSGFKVSFTDDFNMRVVGIAILLLGTFFYVLANSPEDHALRFVYLIIIPIFFLAFRLQIQEVLTLLLVSQIMLAMAFIYRGTIFVRVLEVQLMILILSTVIIFFTIMIIESRELSLKARMIESSKNLASMTSIILHEIAQPITALGTYSKIHLDTLEADGEKDINKLKSYAQNMNTEIVRVRELFLQIKSSLNYSHDNSVPVSDVVIVLKSVLNLVQPSASALGVLIKSNIDIDSLSVFSSQQNLSIVLRNLFINAIQSASKSVEKTVQINMEQSADFCYVDIIDSGEVISRKGLLKIFDFGFSTSANGLGLGLFIAKDLMRACNGDIHAYANQKLKFRIAIPKSHAREQ